MEIPNAANLCTIIVSEREFSKRSTGNHPKCDAMVTVAAKTTECLGHPTDRALFLFFFQRLVAGAATAGGEIYTGVETRDHHLTEGAMRLGVY